jgi:hypothetical protein
MPDDRPDLRALFARNAERLRGIHGWPDIERVGRTNLKRLRELLADEALAAVSMEAPLAERREWSRAAEALRDAHERAREDKPCLPRLRVEVFQAADEVLVYLGDTPNALVSGWVRAKVLAVVKAHRPEWNDGSANGGYYWEVRLETAAPAFRDALPLRCSTSEPRVLHAADHQALLAARDADPEFFRIFVENAQRTWTPLWCLERDLRVVSGLPDVRAWFDAH